MKQEDFNHVLESLIKLKNCTDVQLQEEVDKNWIEIISQHYVFDRRKRAIEYLKDLKPSTVIKWLNNLCGNKANVRKLSVQVVAENKKEKDTEPDGAHETDETVGNLAFQLLPKDVEKSDFFIKNIQEFKKDLHVFPAHKIVS